MPDAADLRKKMKAACEAPHFSIATCAEMVQAKNSGRLSAPCSDDACHDVAKRHTALLPASGRDRQPVTPAALPRALSTSARLRYPLPFGSARRKSWSRLAWGDGGGSVKKLVAGSAKCCKGIPYARLSDRGLEHFSRPVWDNVPPTSLHS